MKALYLLFHGFAPYSGITKKIKYQISALEECGFEVDICYMTIDENGFQKRIFGNKVIDNYGNGYKAKLYKWIHFSSLTEAILNSGIKFIYIRSFYNTNPPLLKMLKKLHEAGIKIVMEVPTYPYDSEFRNSPLKDKFRGFINKLYRKELKRYIYRIVTFTDYPTIHGIRTINISNGIDFDSIKMKKIVNNTPSKLTMIGVADIHYWHGFDRVIEGLHQYYKDPQTVDVYFNIVGEGVEKEVAMMKSMTKKYGLEKYVKFLGSSFGDELDNLFEKSDFGIASLGRHRSGITYIKTLKNREYAARGIPFIYSEIDDDFEQMPYVMKANPDESPINVKSIVDFYKNQTMTPSEIRNSIINTLSWSVQMRKVVRETFSEQ